MENPQQLIRSWALQGSFANGAVSQDKLVPREFTRIRTPFVNTWRQEQLASTCDWESQAFSWHVPESLRIVSSMFLRIELPAVPAVGWGFCGWDFSIESENAFGTVAVWRNQVTVEAAREVGIETVGW